MAAVGFSYAKTLKRLVDHLIPGITYYLGLQRTCLEEVEWTVETRRLDWGED